MHELAKHGNTEHATPLLDPLGQGDAVLHHDPPGVALHTHNALTADYVAVVQTTQESDLALQLPQHTAVVLRALDKSIRVWVLQLGQGLHRADKGVCHTKNTWGWRARGHAALMLHGGGGVRFTKGRCKHSNTGRGAYPLTHTPSPHPRVQATGTWWDGDKSWPKVMGQWEVSHQPSNRCSA